MNDDVLSLLVDIRDLLAVLVARGKPEDPDSSPPAPGTYYGSVKSTIAARETKPLTTVADVFRGRPIVKP